MKDTNKCKLIQRKQQECIVTFGNGDTIRVNFFTLVDLAQYLYANHGHRNFTLITWINPSLTNTSEEIR